MKKSELKALIREVIQETQGPSPAQSTTISYEVELADPDAFVTFDGPAEMSNDEILNRAIQELTRKTSVWRVVKKG